jgi:amino acid transporter
MTQPNPPPFKKLRILQLAAVIFFTVSGGPYGIEPLLGYVGKNAALLLLLLTPILWDIPTIFTVLELNGMMPVEGGYYQWVKRALGIKWAFYEGCWTWLYTFVDLAIYPVLFVEYASFFFPQVAEFKVPLCLIIIWTGAALNIRGIVPVGKISALLSIIVLTPFLILLAVLFFHHPEAVTAPHLSFDHVGFSSFGMGLYTVMWNFFGWDNATTYAGEVNKPVKSYMISMSIAFLLIFIMYQIAVYTAQQSGIDLKVFSDRGFPAAGVLLGGKWMGAVLAVGGMASALGLFSAVLLSVSRVPRVMADDELLPAKFHSLHPKYKTPYISIIVCAIVVSLMILWTFTDLLIMDVTLYGAGLFLEFISLIVLRIKMPNQHRPFKIPLNIFGLCVMILLSVTVYVIGLTGAFLQSEKTFIPAVFAVGALCTAEIVWRIIVWRKPHILSREFKIPEPILSEQK